jgi:hypothetical protein
MKVRHSDAAGACLSSVRGRSRSHGHAGVLVTCGQLMRIFAAVMKLRFPSYRRRSSTRHPTECLVISGSPVSKTALWAAAVAIAKASA